MTTMIEKSILTPPVAFIIVLAVTILISGLLSKSSFRTRRGEDASTTSYSCGEEGLTPLIQPDYSQFFPFAFFFTILHVTALMITTVPIETLGSLSIAVVYLAGAMTALFILFRK
jgi:NADH:ubiquinone oxidoreductase subunit 3 (subunit A)